MTDTDNTSKWFKTKQEISDSFGVDRGTVREWSKASTFPGETKWGWNRKKATAWIDAHNKERQAQLPDDGDKARKLRLECERLEVSINREKEVLAQEEIKTMQLRGQLIPVEQLREDITDLVQMFTAGLDQATIDFGAKTRNAKHTASLKKTLDGLRRKLSAGLENA